MPHLRVDPLGGLIGQVAGHHVEPMDGEIVQNQIVDAIKHRPHHPVMIPVHRQIDATNCAELPRCHQPTHIGHMRRPAAVLVDGQFNAVALGQFYQALAFVQIEHKRFLAEHMLAGTQRRMEQWHAVGRMGGDVDYFDVVAAQYRLDVGVDLGFREKFLAAGFGPSRIHIT